MKRPDKLATAAIAVVVANPTRTGTIRALEDVLEATYPGAIERAKERRQKAREDARFTGPVPLWARRMVLKYASPSVTLKVRQSRVKSYTSGHCKLWSDDLVVTFGHPFDGMSPRAIEVDRKTVVLHEIAHANSHDMHGDKFYRELRRLLVAEGLLRAHAQRVGKARARKAALAR